MHDLLVKYKCPTCQQAVLNRRINHCLYCGSTLPAEFLFSDDKIARIDRETFNRDELQGHSNPEQVIKRQGLFSELVDDADVVHPESEKDEDRSDGIRAMDAVIGGFIGFVICSVLGLIFFKRGHFNETRMSLYFAVVTGGTLLGAIGSWLVGTTFWQQVFSLFKGK